MCVAQNCVDGDIALRHRQLCTKQYGVNPQKTVLLIVTAVTTSYLTWYAGHTVFVHFEDIFRNIKSKSGMGSKSGRLFKGKKQIRKENRKKCYCFSTMEFLNDAVCGDGADYQFSIYFLLSPLLSPGRTFQFLSPFSLRTNGSSNINHRNVAAQFVIEKAKWH
jgi:hypothetical protein